jgi:hypothetical protein
MVGSHPIVLVLVLVLCSARAIAPNQTPIDSGSSSMCVASTPLLGREIGIE